jgi:hypothetical protein
MIKTNDIKPAGPVEPQKLTDPLPPGYSIYHINGDKFDNRPENLEIRRSLNHVTTDELKQPAPEPEATRGTDPAKMITTHNIEEHLAKTGASNKPGIILVEDETPVQAPIHKKPGRPRK